MMLEAQVKGLKEEAAILQEQLESKDEALTAVQQAVSQAYPALLYCWCPGRLWRVVSGVKGIW